MSMDREAMAMVGLVAARKGVACAIRRKRCPSRLYEECVSEAYLRLAAGLAGTYDASRQEWSKWAWHQGYYAAAEVRRRHLELMARPTHDTAELRTESAESDPALAVEESAPEWLLKDAVMTMFPVSTPQVDREVAWLVGNDCSDAEIGRTLGIHRHTARFRRRRALSTIRSHIQRERVR